MPWSLFFVLAYGLGITGFSYYATRAIMRKQDNVTVIEGSYNKYTGKNYDE
jgi:hypothetical protein